jgi:hypothetical protein
MGEQQIVPRLRHQPRSVRHPPGPMCDSFEDGRLEVVVGHAAVVMSAADPLRLAGCARRLRPRRVPVDLASRLDSRR